MGLLSRIFNRRHQRAASAPHLQLARKPQLEAMESRRNMAADVKVGVVYIEEDSGSDLHGDRFEVQFEGGADGTELKQLVIDTDHGPPGLSFGDLLFDTIKGGLGADEAFDLQIVSKGGIADVQWSVDDGGTTLVFDFQGFFAGDKLVFTVDVDEVQDFDPAETNLTKINEGIDPITSGVEFQGSLIGATFAAPNYFDATGSDEFRNLYDPKFVGTNLLANPTNPNGLPADDAGGKRDRSTGALAIAKQEPIPVELSGYVYEDNDNDGNRDLGEKGISGVTVRVIPVDTIEPQNEVTLTTDANGFYRATNLMPGKYRVVEVQPTAYRDGLDTAGTVTGIVRGRAVNPGDNLEDIAIEGGDVGLEYNFGELAPASIRGRVHLTDRFGNCFAPDGSVLPPVVGAEVRLFDAAGVLLKTTFTDLNGEYEFANLTPGKYKIVEITPDDLIDGGDHVGKVDGALRGKLNGNDVIDDILLNGGDDGVEYDFCEKLPSELSGYVHHDESNDGIFDLLEDPIANVELNLIDSTGAVIATTKTDAVGYYRFGGLRAGVYRVVEKQPTGWSDGLDTPGTVAGVNVGKAVNPGDRLEDIELFWGDTGLEYNFGELQRASISGKVWVDTQRDKVKQADEMPLAGVTVDLYNAAGQKVATTTTNAEGKYEFTDLAPGRYEVRESQPAGYFQGGQMKGSKGGDDSLVDIISAVELVSGDVAVNYDFCELPPVAISGIVFVDLRQDKIRQEDEPLLAGVTVQLLNEQGTVIGSVTTDANGAYRFTQLAPGTYAVRELQPTGYFQGGQIKGTTGGDDSTTDLIRQITIASGESKQNNFAEVPPASISGFVFRDGPVMQTADGKAPANLDELRDGVLTADDLRLAGVTLELRHTGTADPVLGEETLPGTNPNGPLRVVTDANGYYEFRGLRNGNYSVLQVQPAGYVDHKDTAGPLGGLAVNPNAVVDPLTLETFSIAGVSLNHDAILRIALGVGQAAVLNNFSEVQFTSLTIPELPPKTPEPPPPGNPPVRPAFPVIPPLPEFLAPQNEEIVTGGNPTAYSWHLSVINQGAARATNYSTWINGTPWRPASNLLERMGLSGKLDQGSWSLPSQESDAVRLHALFGLPEAIPVVGDFNGDGHAEIGVFVNGEWFIDLNGNGRWDEGDLWARLGTEQDKPVVGDWDGDGKDDIGIYGPEWQGDPRHIEHEPGLPDAANTRPLHRPRNVPPKPDEATEGKRLERQPVRADERSDLIDHVFRFGVPTDVPVAGDWNGDGIASIGVFRDGKWCFDEDGDGRWSQGDQVATFGQIGDKPVVGDFNGDGQDEIGVFRGGLWILDTNGNREIDPGDKRLELGRPDDLPAIGDFNGDGVDEPVTYSPNFGGHGASGGTEGGGEVAE